jgi:hypothetical protein
VGDEHTDRISYFFRRTISALFCAAGGAEVARSGAQRHGSPPHDSGGTSESDSQHLNFFSGKNSDLEMNKNEDAATVAKRLVELVANVPRSNMISDSYASVASSQGLAYKVQIAIQARQPHLVCIITNRVFISADQLTLARGSILRIAFGVAARRFTHAGSLLWF